MISQKLTLGYDYLLFIFEVLSPPSTRPSLRWDFFLDAFPMMFPCYTRKHFTSKHVHME